MNIHAHTHAGTRTQRRNANANAPVSVSSVGFNVSPRILALAAVLTMILGAPKLVHSFAPLTHPNRVNAHKNLQHFQKEAKSLSFQHDKKRRTHSQGHGSLLSQRHRRHLDTSKGYSSLPYNDDAEAGNRKQGIIEVTTKVVRVKSSSAGVAANVMTAKTEEEYTQALDRSREQGKLVVVRFFASWCKTCQAIAPSFNRLARRNPRVVFIEVPVTQENADFVQNKLHVTTIPTAHIHHPDIPGPAEDLRISKKHWSGFESTFHDYIKGFCTVLDCDYSNPLERTGVELSY